MFLMATLPFYNIHSDGWWWSECVSYRWFLWIAAMKLERMRSEVSKLGCVVVLYVCCVHGWRSLKLNNCLDDNCNEVLLAGQVVNCCVMLLGGGPRGRTVRKLCATVAASPSPSPTSSPTSSSSSSYSVFVITSTHSTTSLLQFCIWGFEALICASGVMDQLIIYS